ncbi:hypothetical protein OSTOST_03014 [Ostertagia ostertagi]
MPLWATRMMERYDACAERLEKALLTSFDKMNVRQGEIPARISALNSVLNTVKRDVNQNALYSTKVEVKADERKIDDKLRRIAWVGLGEQKDDIATKKFDKEALKEVIGTFDDAELMEEFSKGNISVLRHPAGQPRGINSRGRIIKISLPSQELMDRLLQSAELDETLRKSSKDLYW